MVIIYTLGSSKSIAWAAGADGDLSVKTAAAPGAAGDAGPDTPAAAASATENEQVAL